MANPYIPIYYGSSGGYGAPEGGIYNPDGTIKKGRNSGYGGYVPPPQPAPTTAPQPPQPAASSNPTVVNPFAQANSIWSSWQQPTDATARGYYTQHPREAYQQFEGAYGAPNGNLQKFIDSQFGQLWANYIKQTADSTKNLDMQFTDTLTPDAGQQLQQQWQGQTPYQRGENYGSLGAGRRV